jgi:hypothetical protein
MAEYFVAFAAFFAQSELPPPEMLKVVSDLDDAPRPDPGETVDHCSDKRLVTQPNESSTLN